jgi:hypothetical protein
VTTLQLQLDGCSQQDFDSLKCFFNSREKKKKEERAAEPQKANEAVSKCLGQQLSVM